MRFETWNQAIDCLGVHVNIGLDVLIVGSPLMLRHQHPILVPLRLLLNLVLEILLVLGLFLSRQLLPAIFLVLPGCDSELEFLAILNILEGVCLFEHLLFPDLVTE